MATRRKDRIDIQYRMRRKTISRSSSAVSNYNIYCRAALGFLASLRRFHGRLVAPPSEDGDQLSRFSFRQPPALLLAMICLNIALSAGALIVAPWRIATVRSVVLSCPPVMIFSGSGTIGPS